MTTRRPKSRRTIKPIRVRVDCKHEHDDDPADPPYMRSFTSGSFSDAGYRSGHGGFGFTQWMTP